ncbi:hypothetical protein Q7P37_008109 [Cladosporium fusiforme]
MNGQITQQQREDVARQLQQWGIGRNIPQRQLDQMTQAVLVGNHDAQIIQSMPTVRKPVINQHQPFVQPAPLHGFQTPFGFFPIPRIPPLPMLLAPNIFPPPPMAVPNMFPLGATHPMPHAPNVQTTRTAIPGGEMLQQSSSYAGQQGNTTIQYSASSTSVNMTPGAQLPQRPPPFAPINFPQYPDLPVPDLPALPGPLYTPEYFPPQARHVHQPPLVPVIERQVVHPPTPRRSPSPDPVFNPAVAPQEPHNARLAEVLENQLNEEMEETYFSDPPGMPDASVRR